MANDGRRLKLGLAAYGTGWDVDAWRLPDATNAGLGDPRVISDIATTAERGLFDYVFVGSALASEPDRLNRVFRWDSAVYAGHAAARTTNVGFLVTYNSSYEHPYFVARQLATLDRFSGGRAALNVVSVSIAKAAPARISVFIPCPTSSRSISVRPSSQMPSTGCFESWDADFLLDDREGGTLIRPGSWHQVDFAGEFFEIQGPLNVAPPIQTHIPNVHVGLSPASLDYGARYAQARFSPYFGLENGKAHYASHKQRVREAGGDADRFLIIPGVTFYVGRDDARSPGEAREILDLELTERLPASFAKAFGLEPEQVDVDAGQSATSWTPAHCRSM